MRHPVMSNSSAACTLQSFDLSSEAKSYCQNYDDVTYGSFAMDSTVATDFGLICDDQYKVALVGSIYMAGLFCGSYPFGYISDRFGRRKGTMIAVLTGATFQLIGAFM